MTERIWVLNASPLILLGKINRLRLVDQLTSRTVVPRAVFDEITGGEPNTYTQQTLDWAKQRVQPDIAVPASIVAWDIGQGESQVLARCLLQEGGKAILDDGKARAAALSHRIQLHGTLGIIIRAKRSGLITAVRPLIEQLVDNGSYLGTDLIQKVLSGAGE